MQYPAFLTATDELGEGTKVIANGVGNLPSDMSTPEAIKGYKDMGEGVKSVAGKTVVIGAIGLTGGAATVGLVSGVAYGVVAAAQTVISIGTATSNCVAVNSDKIYNTATKAAEFTEALLVTGPVTKYSKAAIYGFTIGETNKRIIQPYVIPKVKKSIKDIKETFNYSNK